MKRFFVLRSGVSSARAGFTLIEMSVVLVLVGLLLGGVLKGQQLIESTRLKMTISQWEATRTAVSAFEDRFGALPGDFDEAATFLANGVADGDGNGVIGTAGLTMGAAPAAESGLAWVHLAYGNFLAGVRLGTAADGSDSTMPARLSGESLAIIHGRFGRTAATGHWLRLQDTLRGPTRAALSGAQAREIDIRYDDGNADSGYIVMSAPDGETGTADACKDADGFYVGGAAGLCNPVLFLQ
ncbi:prepilin-type cleavage/methylation domain-containing protein [Rhodospirillum rubrum]|uniref:prepilin-type N-terminal cleavage/methylation domain-containing protein n=1 Tax=Rhodospirillum rubrum TaxID=1085 RepID=UPI00190401BE|nr:prepilin-type N-terminal cleavage/methylation domain-containing protein [Rhodospirillum rubrum]MBK1664365.1 prepilin-type cleavage/methylation domain-containing protein [Rhodospirillum rubrum]MBK1676121.1 prepilin-type cleavage/methylation domain-containing protein [Rhodospirillum rubrum]